MNPDRWKKIEEIFNQAVGTNIYALGVILVEKGKRAETARYQ